MDMISTDDEKFLAEYESSCFDTPSFLFSPNRREICATPETYGDRSTITDRWHDDPVYREYATSLSSRTPCNVQSRGSLLTSEAPESTINTYPLTPRAKNITPTTLSPQPQGCMVHRAVTNLVTDTMGRASESSEDDEERGQCDRTKTTSKAMAPATKKNTKGPSKKRSARIKDGAGDHTTNDKASQTDLASERTTPASSRMPFSPMLQSFTPAHALAEPEQAQVRSDEYWKAKVFQRTLLEDYIQYRVNEFRMRQTGIKAPPVASSPPTSSQAYMRHLTSNFCEKHYGPLFQEIDMTQKTAKRTLFRVLNKIFVDVESCSWKRIALMFHFAAEIAIRCVKNNIPNMTEQVVEHVSLFIEENVQHWVDLNGGWCAFEVLARTRECQKWRDCITQSKLSNMLVLLGVGAILTAALGYLCRSPEKVSHRC